MASQNHSFRGRLIVVDDEREIMVVLSEILSGQGYEIRGFTSAREALSAIKEEEFDLLLTDLMMPEMDGVTLLKKGWEIDATLMGIIMTSHDSLRTAAAARNIGAFDYVLKPFKMNILLSVLWQAIRVKKLRMEASGGPLASTSSVRL